MFIDVGKHYKILFSIILARNTKLILVLERKRRNIRLTQPWKFVETIVKP